MKHRPRRRFGQNFLHDPGIIQRIVSAIDAKPGQSLIEIGPGQGALTWPLLDAAGQLTVIEIDRDLAVALRATERAGLTVVEQDVLTVAFDRWPGPLRVVGNLPYNISTPILFHLLEFAPQIEDLHFMLQQEVVDRMVAAPGSGQYGRLTVAVQYHCDCERLLRVPPGCFRPAPKVDSAVIRLRPRPPRQPARSEQALDLVLRAAFAQRRKTLRNCLRKLLQAEQIEAAGVDPSLRPERLTVEEFVRLSDLVEIDG